MLSSHNNPLHPANESLKMPLIDLHFHLDGSLSIDTIITLAEIQGIKLPSKDRNELKHKLTLTEFTCKNLDDFLDKFAIPSKLLQTKIGIKEGVRLLREEMTKEGLIYLEIRFAPQKHTYNGLTQEDAINAALEGLKEDKNLVHTNLILCMMRGDKNKKENFETIELAKKYLVEDNGVVGIDLAGSEGEYKTFTFKDEFDLIKKYKIPTTIHAGEADGYESVEKAVEFGATRIGHGIAASQNKNTMDLLSKKGVILEMCPTSNFVTKASSRDKYPLREFFKNNVKCTINTDDKGVATTTLANEFKILEDICKLTKEEERSLLLNSADAAFTINEVKKHLREKINIYFDQF